MPKSKVKWFQLNYYIPKELKKTHQSLEGDLRILEHVLEANIQGDEHLIINSVVNFE